MSRHSSGSLTAVGIGYRPAHITHQVSSVIKHADKVFFSANGPGDGRWLRRLNPNTEAMGANIVDQLLGPVRQGLSVCAVFSGHPAIAANGLHQALARAKADGFQTRIVAGISPLDCLFADIGFDPVNGYQFFDTGELLKKKPKLDPHCATILIQANSAHLKELSKALKGIYGARHDVIIYDPVAPSEDVRHVSASRLSEAVLPPSSVLFVPARTSR